MKNNVYLVIKYHYIPLQPFYIYGISWNLLYLLVFLFTQFYLQPCAGVPLPLHLLPRYVFCEMNTMQCRALFVLIVWNWHFFCSFALLLFFCFSTHFYRRKICWELFVELQVYCLSYPIQWLHSINTISQLIIVR